MEPEAIVTHKKLGAKIQYRIHWRGLSNEEETWVNAEDFNDKAILKQYWTVHLDPNNQPRGSGRRKYVPEYIQQFYRDYIQDPSTIFPDFQPEVEKPRAPKQKNQQGAPLPFDQIGDNMYQENDNELLKAPVPMYPNDKRIYEAAIPLAVECDSSGQTKVKVRLPNGCIAAISRTDAFQYMPSQMNQFFSEKQNFK